MTVTVKLTSDFICPWCLIGSRRLALAIDALPAAVAVETQWLPFELNPDMPAEGVDRRTYRTRKFGSWDRSQALDAQTVAAGAPDGVVFDYDRMTRTPNTFQAHRLSLLAARAGCQQTVAEAVLQAYFVDGRDIGDRDALTAIAADCGLDAATVRTFLDGDEDADTVRLLEVAAQARGIAGVPHMVIGGLVTVGAQPVDTLRQAILDAAQAAAPAAG